MKDIDRFIREKECIALTTLAKLNTLENGAAGKFPRRIKIGERAAGYRLSEVSGMDPW